MRFASNIVRAALVGAALGSLFGCGGTAVVAAAPVGGYLAYSLWWSDTDIADYNHRAAAAVADAAKGLGGPVMVAALADAADAGSASAFGQIAAEQIATGLVADGVKVTDAFLPKSLVLGPNGEFSLAEAARAVAERRGVAGIVVGTYARGDKGVLVAVRLVRVSDGAVLAASDYAASAAEAGADSLLARRAAAGRRTGGEVDGFR